MKVMKLMGTKHRALSAVWQQNHRKQAAAPEGICPLPELPVGTFLMGNICRSSRIQEIPCTPQKALSREWEQGC